MNTESAQINDSEPHDEAAEAAALAVQVAGDATPAVPEKVKRPKKVQLLNATEELSMAALKRRDRGQTIKLRWNLALFAIIAVSCQLVLADVIFGWYLWANGWRDLPPQIMIAWMSSTVVEVIGIVLIIARNLFPSGERSVTRRDLRTAIQSIKKT